MEPDFSMESFAKPFVHVPIDAVDTVVFDPEGRFDPERYDRYDSFDAARDAALSSIEIMLDEEDYDGDDHREELERMLELLESSSTYDDLKRHAAHGWLLAQLDSAQPAAA
jgi:hypothetical protein